MWVHLDVVAMAAVAWLESFCQRGHGLAVVDCSVVECDDCGSQWLARDVSCLLTSVEDSWRQWMLTTCYLCHLFHSPTHRLTLR